MKALVISDLHLEIDPAPSLMIESLDVDLVILAGDVHTRSRGVTWAKETFKVPAAYVAGNHEFYKGHFDNTLQSMKQAAEGSHVHVLENECLVIGRVRILGCTAWTDFSTSGSVFQAAEEAKRGMNDFRKIRAGEGYRALSISDVISRNRESYHWLAQELARDFQGKTVVVTHHCPLVEFSGPQKDSALMPAYSNEWPELVRQADVWVFGHTHSHINEFFEGCQVVTNPYGYPGEGCGFNPGMIIEI